MNIEFMPKRKAEALHPTDNACMISIVDPGEHSRLSAWDNYLKILRDFLDLFTF